MFSSRTGAAGQLTAIDDAVKATNTEVLSIELPRDTKGWGGHGNYIVLGGSDVSDVRHAISMALELTNKYAGEVYISESGHLEFAYSASAGQALNKAFGVPMGEAFGFMAGSPAAGDTGCFRRCQRCKNSSTECQTDWSGASDRNGQLPGDPRDTLFIKKS